MARIGFTTTLALATIILPFEACPAQVHSTVNWRSLHQLAKFPKVLVTEAFRKSSDVIAWGPYLQHDKHDPDDPSELILEAERLIAACHTIATQRKLSESDLAPFGK